MQVRFAAVPYCVKLLLRIVDTRQASGGYEKGSNGVRTCISVITVIVTFIIITVIVIIIVVIVIIITLTIIIFFIIIVIIILTNAILITVIILTIIAILFLNPPHCNLIIFTVYFNRIEPIPVCKEPHKYWH